MNRRIIPLLLCLVLVFSLSICASAENVASYVQNYATITSDGNCEVTLTVALRFDSPVEKLTFPLPKDASNIKWDGNNAKM